MYKNVKNRKKLKTQEHKRGQENLKNTSTNICFKELKTELIHGKANVKKLFMLQCKLPKRFLKIHKRKRNYRIEKVNSTCNQHWSKSPYTKKIE